MNATLEEQTVKGTGTAGPSLYTPARLSSNSGLHTLATPPLQPQHGAPALARQRRLAVAQRQQPRQLRGDA